MSHILVRNGLWPLYTYRFPLGKRARHRQDFNHFVLLYFMFMTFQSFFCVKFSCSCCYESNILVYFLLIFLLQRLLGSRKGIRPVNNSDCWYVFDDDLTLGG